MTGHASQEAILDALLPAQAAAYVKDREGRYLMVSPTGASTLGYSQDALIGKTDVEVFAGQLGERLWRSDQDLMAAGETRIVQEPVLVAGRVRRYLSTKAPLRDSSGLVVGLVGVSIDASLGEAEEALRRSEAQLAEAQALTRVGSWEVDLGSGQQWWSDETYRIIGRDRSEGEPAVDAYLACVHAEDRERLIEQVARASAPGSAGTYAMEHRLMRTDGAERICRCLPGAAEHLGRILDSAHEAFVAMDAGGFITEWNQAAEDAFGWSRAEAVGRVLAELVIPAEFRDAHWAGVQRFLRTEEASVLGRRMELSAVHRDGRVFPVELTISALITEGRWEFHAFVRDNSDRKRYEVERDALIERLDALARTDELTGLWNRRAWEEELSRELARAARDGRGLCVTILDLDGFKAYNDREGHQAGDELLRIVAHSWRAKLRATDVLARYGGEEFVVAFPALTLDAALLVVERLRTDIPAGQTCSAGLVSWDGEEGAAHIVGRADKALYDAKRAGRNQTVARP